MTRFGCTMMTEQSRPDQLVRDVQVAEDAGFDFSVISDHYSPWLEEQGEAGCAWSILGAAAQATSRIPLMTYVTCPTLRYHPAVVAQKAMTMQILSGGRFRLGLGAGENLDEHVVGKRWPSVGERHEMLLEATGIIRRLLDGEHVDHRGTHVDVESAHLYSRWDTRPEIGLAASGPSSIAVAAEHADFLIATDPLPELVRSYDEAAGPGRSEVGQIAGCWGPDRDAAVAEAHEQFRWSGLGWKVNADLPGPSSFDAATQFVTPEQVGEQLPCGPDVQEWVDKIRPFVDAGFTEVALVQIGADSQEPFCRWAEAELLPALRAL